MAETLGHIDAPLEIIHTLISALPDSFPCGDDLLIENVLPFLLYTKLFFVDEHDLRLALLVIMSYENRFVIDFVN